MAEFPIKMLKDEEGKPFVPVISAKTIILTSGWDLETEMWKRLTADDIIAGRNITINKDGNKCTINGPAIMNNLTTTEGNLGVLDAYQGKVLNDKITTLDGKVNDNQTNNEKELNDLKTRTTNLENNKVDKRTGYDLSKNDFTDALLAKLNGIEAGAQVNTVLGVKGDAEDNYRVGNINITKANIGLGNVENKNSATIRSEITGTNVTDALGYVPMDSAIKGKPNGVAELDSEGHVPASQLPSYVDDVLEFDSKEDFPATGESGKIYVATNTNLSYRWTGSTYVTIASDLALGETENTAYRGDRGKMAYEHAVLNKGEEFASGFYKFATNDEGHITSAIKVQKNDITDLGIPGSDTTYENATQESAGLMSAEDKIKLDNLEKMDFLENYLSKTNTTEYTPTEDYHPATKKYVDDAAPKLPENLATFENEFSEDKVRLVVSEEKPDPVEGYVDLWINPFDETTGDDYVKKDLLKETVDDLTKEISETYVKLTGNEEIKGVKTFKESPIVPTPEKDTDAVNKKYVDETMPVLPENHVEFENDHNTDKVRLFVSEVRPAPVEGYIDLWVNPNDITTGDDYVKKDLLYSTLDDISKTYVKLSGDEVIKGIKTFSSIPVLPDTEPVNDNHAVNKKYVDDKITAIDISTKAVMLTGNQSIGGVKTFANAPIIPLATNDSEAANKGYVDNQIKSIDVSSKAVMLTDNQTIKGIKTFEESPIVPTPTEDMHVATKKYVDEAAPKLPDNLITSENDYDESKVRIIISETKPEEAEGYIDLWINPDKDSSGGIYVKKEYLDTVLQQYYGKTETYSRKEVDTAIENSKFSKDYNELINTPNIPTKIGELVNDEGYITKAVEDLTNYYTKNNIDNLLNNLHTLDLEIITSFPEKPSTTTIYLKAKISGEENNIYDEYIYINGNWEKIGDTKVDLSDYYKKAEVDGKINLKANATDLENHIKDTVTHVTAEDKTRWNAKSDFNGSYTTLTDKPDIPVPGTATPLVAGNATPGSASGYARIDHVHPLQTSVSGNAGTATKLAKAVNINGVGFDGSSDITIPVGITAVKATNESTAQSLSKSNPNVIYYWE